MGYACAMNNASDLICLNSREPEETPSQRFKGVTRTLPPAGQEAESYPNTLSEKGANSVLPWGIAGGILLSFDARGVRMDNATHCTAM